MKTCRECNKPLPTDRRPTIEFCGTPCRVKWRNRRSSRGADLYDLFMALRFDRAAAKELGLYAEMCKMASEWRKEDKAAGRQSYFRPDRLKGG